MKFLPVVGYEGLYEVSDTGVIRSVSRTVLGKDNSQYPFKGRQLCAHPNKDVKYLQVSLWKNGVGTSHYVHRLVAIAHIPNPDNLPEVNHDNGNRVDNHVTNLYWITSLGNKQHAIATGLRVYTNKLTYDEFVACLFSVIEGESYFSLTSRVPYKVPFLSVKLRSIARELGVEQELNDSLYIQRVERARINGTKNRPSH